MKQEIINHQNLDIILDKFFLNQSDANNLYNRCLNDISWQSSAITMFGKKLMFQGWSAGMEIWDVNIPIQVNHLKDLNFQIF